MQLAVDSFATYHNIRKEAAERFANGEALILKGGGSHDEKAVSQLLSLPDFQKDVAVGAGVGGAAGLAAGILVEQITHVHPAAGVAGKILLAIFGGLGSVIGGVVAREASAEARQIPTGRAPVRGKLLAPSPTVEIGYNPQTRELFARLMQQTTK